MQKASRPVVLRAQACSVDALKPAQYEGVSRLGSHQRPGNANQGRVSALEASQRRFVDNSEDALMRALTYDARGPLT